MFNAKHTSKEMSAQNIQLKKKYFQFCLNQNFIKKTLHPKRKNIFNIQKENKNIPKKKNTRSTKKNTKSTKKHPRIRMEHKEGKKNQH